MSFCRLVKLIQWFNDNQMKAIKDKYHFLKVNKKRTFLRKDNEKNDNSEYKQILEMKVDWDTLTVF